MKAGSLRHQITIQFFNQTGVGTRGEKVGDWEYRYENVPASIETLSGREAEIARQSVATVTTKITIRFLPDITSKDRIVFNNRIFNIESINNANQMNRELVFLCSGVAE